MSSRKRREKGWARIGIAVVLGLALVVAGAAVAFAKGGGTAKPPVGATSPFVTPTLADPLFSVAPADIHGFDETGFIQDATVSDDNSACPDVSQANRQTSARSASTVSAGGGDTPTPSSVMAPP